MNAVPAKRGVWKTLPLADGTEVRAQLVGDEHGHYWQSADGTAYTLQSGQQFYAKVDKQQISRRAKVRRQQINAKRIQRLQSRRASEANKYVGDKRAVIILIDFPDLKFKSGHNNNLYQKIANQENYNEGSFVGSMADYFKAQSGGQFVLAFDVLGPVTVSKKHSYYGENDPDNNDADKYAGEMVCEAVKLAKNLTSDWRQYDWDGDGYVDQVYLVYAGKGEADGGDESTVWPHSYNLSMAKQYGDGDGKVNVGIGIYVNTYACGPELDVESKIGGIGTMCHEYSHCLGYPDFYDTDYSGGQGMCYWDLMDGGSYNGDGFQPAGYTSYERWMAGWLEPIELGAEDRSITDMKSLQNDGECYVIYNKGNKNEYFLLENRQLEGWDASLPAAGLMILHCDYDASAWLYNEVNQDPDHQRFTWVPADGEYQSGISEGEVYYTWFGMLKDLFPQRNVTSFNKDFKTKDNKVKKAAMFFNKNTDNTYWLDSSVENITQNSDKTISFDFVASYGDSGGPSAIQNISVKPRGDAPIYTIDGRYVGTDPNRLPRGLYILNGKKFVK